MHHPLIMVEVNLNTPNENAAKDQLRQPCMHCLTTIINLKPLLAENNPLGLVFWQSRVKASSALTLFNATFVRTTPQGWSFKNIRKSKRNEESPKCTSEIVFSPTKPLTYKHTTIDFKRMHAHNKPLRSRAQTFFITRVSLFYRERKPFLSREHTREVDE